MKLLLIRHGIAMDHMEAHHLGFDDEQRELTQKGRDRMHEIGKELSSLVPQVNGLLTSPLVRAQQTSEILSQYWNILPKLCDELSIYSPISNFYSKVSQDHYEDQIIVGVGHEPHLSQFTSYALSGGDSSFINFKKGGAAFLDFPFRQNGSLGRAELKWLVTYKTLGLKKA